VTNRHWVRTVVPRYRDDPTIAMWELINEPAVEAALAVDKPLLVGEWGLNAGPPGDRDEDGVGCHTVEERYQVAKSKLAAYLDTPVVAGALYWSYTAEENSICKLSTTRRDPLVELIRNIPIPLTDQQ